MRSHLSLCFSCVPAWWSCWMMIFRSDPCAMKQFTCHSAPLVESLLWALETSFLQLDPKPSPMLSWTNLLLVFRRPALFFFCIEDLWGHIFVCLCQAAPPDPQLRGRWPSWFCLLCGGHFSDYVLLLFVIFENYAILWKLSSHACKGSILRVWAPLNVMFYHFKPLLKTWEVQEAHVQGEGDPE